MTVTPDEARKRIAGLLRERQGYVNRNLPDRIKQVDEQLKLYGYKSPVEETRRTPPVGRTERPQQTGQQK